MELKLEDDIEADGVDDAHLPPSPVPEPHMCELEDEEDAGEEAVWTLLVLLAAWAGAEVGGVQGLVGTAIVTT
jgi:hypothetical protein